VAVEAVNVTASHNRPVPCAWCALCGWSGLRCRRWHAWQQRYVSDYWRHETMHDRVPRWRLPVSKLQRKVWVKR
jgi:hypothetical protein